MRKIRMHTIVKAALITFPSRKYNKLEREIAIKTRLLRFAWEIQVAELEAALNSVIMQLNMGMIRPRHGKRLIQMYRKQLERKREMKS